MTSTQPLHVLVVDGDGSTRDSLCRFLESEGHRPTPLADAGDAADAVREGRYQMVFLDLGAGLGLEALRRIRSLDDDLCVICTASAPDVETAVQSIKNRAFDYLPKPCEPDRLRPVLREAIRKHGLLVDLEERLNALIGQRIRGRRHELGLTLKQVANRTGLSVSLISQIELGRSAASISTLYKLATALEVKMPFFFQAI